MDEEGVMFEEGTINIHTFKVGIIQNDIQRVLNSNMLRITTECGTSTPSFVTGRRKQSN